MRWELAGRLSRPLGAEVYRGPAHRKALALTFDDGPSESTPELLQLLANQKVPATFFHCGANVRRLPQMARGVAEAGHELGNHSDSHASMLFRGKKFMRSELAKAQESILHATGQRPSLFRPPYGYLWFGLGQIQRELGLTGVMWTTMAGDWKLPTNEIVARLRRGLRNGTIFCLHDGRDLTPNPDIHNTVEALRRIIPEFLDQGYRFETVSQLVRA